MFPASEHYDFDPSSGWVGVLVSILITALFINWAASLVLDRSSFLAAILTAVLGTILAAIVWAAVAGVLGIVLAVAVWALMAAIFYRTDWVKGAIIGVVAWILWVLVTLLIAWILNTIG